MKRFAVTMVPTALLAMLMIGCEEKLTHQRFQMVHEGQARDGVRATLGDPFADTGTQFVYTDNDRGINATIYFNEKGEVIGKQWDDTQQGVHEGKDPRVNKPGDATSTKVRKIE